MPWGFWACGWREPLSDTSTPAQWETVPEPQCRRRPQRTQQPWHSTLRAFLALLPGPGVSECRWAHTARPGSIRSPRCPQPPASLLSKPPAHKACLDPTDASRTLVTAEHISVLIGVIVFPTFILPLSSPSLYRSPVLPWPLMLCPHQGSLLQLPTSSF